ncbi:glycoside hydrolase superfamily [Phyllosticta citriasiana]|uniref:Glycoside hydrolase superfamily n=1 Tax=Phyllosticta citriasiana TaxID=595635 RepID=A0ABR1KSE3_9PEZI
MLAQYLSTALFAVSAFGAVLQERKVSFNWGSEDVRGVSLGGWLVAEPFIKPSLFKPYASQGVVDEYTLGKVLGKEKARQVLEPHWKSWITFADFLKIRAMGFNTVRIPVGFWAFESFGSPYAEGSKEYLDAAIDWARATGLKVLLDLHGAPGSQNGYDNSGQRLDNPGWLQGDTVGQTLQVISEIANQYAQPKYQDVIMGIEVLNEPAGYALDLNRIKQFERDALNIYRGVSDTTVVLHDAFQNPSSFNGWLTPWDNNTQNVVLDHHEYQVFENDLVSFSRKEHRNQVCKRNYRWLGSDKWTIVGEWTAAMTDCAYWLNGVSKGARYDGTFPNSKKIGDCSPYDDISKWDQSLRDDTRRYIETQLDQFELTNGWIFWTLKTESAPEWDLYKLAEAGLFPQPLTQRKFGDGCNT